MSDEVQKVLNYISEHDVTDSFEIARQLNLEHSKVVGAIKSIQCHENVIECEEIKRAVLQLTSEGELLAKDGSYEVNLFKASWQDGALQEDVVKSVANGQIGFSKALASKWIRIDKTEEKPRIYRNVESVEDSVADCLRKLKEMKLEETKPEQIHDCKKRKLVKENKETIYKVRKGPAFTTSLEKGATELTPEMLADGSWKDVHFKTYNFSACGKMPDCGHLHPLLKVREEFRAIFIEMGFSEMPTNRFVESSFWNFDALFQPQQHPARDAHDTFFLKDPEYSDANRLPLRYLEEVKTMHQTGGHGSIGYRYNWSLDEARKNLLRTHTTAVSARMLQRLAQYQPFRPVKYFSIDRVFRNEALDATHLAEFHQIEGLVADRGLHLGHLMGVLNEFFRKLGMKKLRFKPAYNPYTEPSMEVFSYHEGLKKWVEVGNSGVFRPEMLLPMGLPPDVSVIAWGLSLERPTMIKYGIRNIRDLIGPKVNLRMVYDSPICRLNAGGTI